MLNFLSSLSSFIFHCLFSTHVQLFFTLQNHPSITFKWKFSIFAKLNLFSWKSQTYFIASLTFKPSAFLVVCTFPFLKTFISSDWIFRKTKINSTSIHIQLLLSKVIKVTTKTINSSFFLSKNFAFSMLRKFINLKVSLSFQIPHNFSFRRNGNEKGCNDKHHLWKVSPSHAPFA